MKTFALSPSTNPTIFKIMLPPSLNFHTIIFYFVLSLETGLCYVSQTSLECSTYILQADLKFNVNLLFTLSVLRSQAYISDPCCVESCLYLILPEYCLLLNDIESCYMQSCISLTKEFYFTQYHI